MIVMEQEELLTLDEAAQRLRVSKFTIRRYIDDGRLEGVRVGVQWRVKVGAIARYINRNTKPDDKK